MTRNDVWYWIGVCLLGAWLLCTPPAHGAGVCAPVLNNHAIVYPSTTKVYQQQAQQTYQQNYQAVAVAVPLYSASAPGLSPEVILLLQQITESMKQTNALLEAHEARLATVEQQRYQPLPVNPPLVQNAPRRQRVVEPDDAPPDMPPAAAQQNPPPLSNGGTPKLFTTSCVKCHDSAVAAAKGGGFAFMTAGRELPLTCSQMLEMQDRLTMDPADPKYMPKGGKPDEDDVGDVIDHLKQLAKARK